MAGAFSLGPMELLRMIKAKVVLTGAVSKRAGEKLDSDVRSGKAGRSDPQ
jgi:hypothetical protein